MSTEEPAWRAELEDDLREADLDDEDLWPVIAKHIKAAEERGRREALREAAEKIRGYVENRGDVDMMRLFWRGAANYIDPDTP
jgi:hypothetical protein